MAREIAAGGVLVAAIASGVVTVTVLVVKFGELLGWWATRAVESAVATGFRLRAAPRAPPRRRAGCRGPGGRSARSG